MKIKRNSNKNKNSPPPPPQLHVPPYSLGMSHRSMSSPSTDLDSSILQHTFTLASVDGDARGEKMDQSTPKPDGGLTVNKS